MPRLADWAERARLTPSQVEALEILVSNGGWIRSGHRKGELRDGEPRVNTRACRSLVDAGLAEQGFYRDPELRTYATRYRFRATPEGRAMVDS